MSSRSPSRSRFLLALSALIAAGAPGCASQPVGRFVGHDGPIVTATFSADGTRLASIGTDGTVRVWEVSSQRELARAEIPPPPLLYTMNQITFAPDGASIVFAGAASTIYLWRWERGGEPQRILSMTGIPSEVKFSPDSARLIAASGGYAPAMTTGSTTKPTIQPLDVRMFDLEKGLIVSEIYDENCAPLGVALAPDGQRFAVVCLSADGRPVATLPAPTQTTARLSIRDARTGRELVGIDNAGNPLPEFSSNGFYLLAGGRVWDSRTGRLVREVPPNSRTFIDDDQRVLGLDQGMGGWLTATTPWVRPFRIDLKTGRRLNGRSMKVRSLAIIPPLSPDRRYFVDYDLNLWRLSL